MSNKAQALSKAVAIVKEYYSKTNADLWQSIVNQNPTVTIPAALKNRGIEVSDGKVKLNDLINAEVEIDETMGNSKFAKGLRPSELLNLDTKEMRKDTAVKEIEKYTDGVEMDDILNNDKNTIQDLKELIAMFRNS